MFSCQPSLCLSIVCTSVHTLFPFDKLSICKWISFKFCICNCTNNVSLGIVNGQNQPCIMCMLYFLTYVFQLVDGHTLFDYGVGLNDLIQLMVRAPVVSPKKSDFGAGSGDEGSDKENQKVKRATGSENFW